MLSIRYLACLFWGCLLLVWGRPVRAQYEFNAWRFGNKAGLIFLPTLASSPPQPVASRILAIEACASVADSAGNLLLYTSGEQVFDRRDQVLPGG